MTIPRLGAQPPLRPARLHSDTPERRFGCLWRNAHGRILEQDHRLPALPVLDAAHGAFARGALVATPQGPVAIEDLLPGDLVLTGSEGALPVLWIGWQSLRPGPGSDLRLTRIMADAFGIGRPFRDLMMGPGGRLLARPHPLRARIGADQVLTPAHALADGMHAFRLSPRQPVTLYHIGLRRHSVITVNGLQTESFHPGAGFERSLDSATLRAVMRAFPHLSSPQEFGPLAQMRLPLEIPEAV